MKAIALLLMFSIALTAVGQTNTPNRMPKATYPVDNYNYTPLEPVGTTSCPPSVCLIAPQPVYSLLTIEDRGVIVVYIPVATTAPDGKKTYTITTSSDWTCAPTNAQTNFATITCVKSDTPKPTASPVAPKKVKP
jgi:hypothetical protein